MPSSSAAVQRQDQSSGSPQALSPAESAERLDLRERLRARRSVDLFARFWYGSIASLIGCGVLAKLLHDAPQPRWYHAVLAAVLAVAWGLALAFGLRTLRTARVEEAMLARLRGLDARAPQPPELF